MTHATNISFTDVSHQYGCTAHLARAEFKMYGIGHVAIEFCRADMGCRGIELYTVDPNGGEDFLGYADSASRVGIAAHAVIAVAKATVSAGVSERFAALDMAA